MATFMFNVTKPNFPPCFTPPLLCIKNIDFGFFLLCSFNVGCSINGSMDYVALYLGHLSLSAIILCGTIFSWSIKAYKKCFGGREPGS